MDIVAIIFNGVMFTVCCLLGAAVIVGILYVITRILDGVHAIEEIRDHLLDGDDGEEDEDKGGDEEKKDEPAEKPEEKKEE